jgi:formylglycine-generating enzyme required for sulfatase activity
MKMNTYKAITAFAFFLFFSNLINAPDSAAQQVITNKLGMTLVYVPAGSFTMGSPSSEMGRNWFEKQHRVTLSRGFYMSETEITQGQWNRLVTTNPSAFSDLGKNYPVDSVSWNDCMQFIAFLNQFEGTNKYRLPTEAEWEYACRAGSTTAFSSGPITIMSCKEPEPALLETAWYCYNSGQADPAHDLKPHPVKTKRPNAFGLYDMHGNVQEWVMDRCSQRNFWRTRVGVITDTYKNNIIDPLSNKGDHRIIRGGGWFQNSKYQRAAYRGLYKPIVKRNSLGFRVVRAE